MPLLFVLALLLTIFPLIASYLNINLGFGQSATMSIIGLVLLIVVGSLYIFTRLWQKTTTDQALVKVGGKRNRDNKANVIIDGGTLFIPLFDTLTRVSLQTMIITVAKDNLDALITGDKLRANVTAQFYLKVDKNEEDIYRAATTLGPRASNPTQVEQFVNQKFDGALRAVAATKSLEELNSNRKDFESAVNEALSEDLKHNGLTLESVTITHLDQTPKTAFNEDNIFDSQGLSIITKITQQQRVLRNELETAAEQRVSAQNTSTTQYVTNQEVENAKAVADKEFKIRQAQAESEQKAASYTSDQQRLSGLASVQKEQAVALADVEKNRALEVANKQREQAVQHAEVLRSQAVEVATRDQQIAVAKKEQERAEAEALRLAAEAEREKAAQQVKTVEITQTAERDKQRTIISAEAENERIKIGENTKADIEAYQKTKIATAEKDAAENQATAKLRLAQADKEAREFEAAGTRAQQLVPVSVDRERVNVKQADVDVERQRLANESEFSQISYNRQIDLAKIEAEKEVRIASAQAVGEMYSRAHIQMWATADSMSKISDSFLKGQSLGTMLDGLVGSSPKTVESLVGLLAPLLQSLTKTNGQADTDEAPTPNEGNRANTE